MLMNFDNFSALNAMDYNSWCMCVWYDNTVENQKRNDLINFKSQKIKDKYIFSTTIRWQHNVVQFFIFHMLPWQTVRNVHSLTRKDVELPVKGINILPGYKILIFHSYDLWYLPLRNPNQDFQRTINWFMFMLTVYTS